MAIAMANKRKRRSRGSSRPASGNGHGGTPAGTIKATPPSAREQGLLELPTGPGATVYPNMRGSLGRGFYAAGANPIVLIAPMLVVFLVWVALLLAGTRAFPLDMATMFSIPPIGSLFDVGTSLNLFGFAQLGLIGIFLITIVRAVVWAVLIGMLDEMLEYRIVSPVGVLRGLRAFPAVLLYDYLSLGIALAGSFILPQFLGPQLGNTASLGVMVGGVYFLTFAPISAVRQGVPGREAVMRSVKGARLPGWPRHLLMSVVYFLVAVFVLRLLHPAPLAITANPALTTWIFVLGATFVQVGFLGAFIDRWKAIEGYVPQQVQPRQPPPPRKPRNARR